MKYIASRSGFTLIELSIVLVIIGLLVGGILTGQDLIDAATQRAQIAQIEKYNTAVNTFRGKYGYLPGDIPDPYASQFGFQPRGTSFGQGDGNGIIEGHCGSGSNAGFNEGCGELPVFWEDLSEAGLIDVTIFGHDTMGANYPWTTGNNSNVTLNTIPAVKDWLPVAKIGVNSFVYLYSMNGTNYFGISSVTKIGYALESTANPGLTVQQAYNIDKKTDDGLPQSGNITACYVNYDVVNYAAVWAAGSLNQGSGGGNNGQDYCILTTAATPYAATNCYDNSYAGGASATQKYQLQNANAQNCALSFKFQ